MSNKPKIYDITATGSTTPRDIRDRFSDVINVKDFGAVGDGVTDDTEAIQAAIAAMKTRKVQVGVNSTAGPMLFFPYGVYLISKTLSISWAQRVGIYLDGATIRATASMEAMLSLDGNYQQGNIVSGGKWDMGHVASCGIQVTRSNAKFRLRDITIVGVGNGTGLYLGDDEATSRDGMEHMLENVMVSDFVSNDSDQNGSEVYDGVGIKIAVNDCQYSNIIVGCCKTGIQIASGAGGHTFQNVHVWQRMQPDNARWTSTIGIEDSGDNNSWDGLYLDNMGIGYRFADGSRRVSIDSLFYIKQKTPDTSANTVRPVIFNGVQLSQLRVENLYVYQSNIENDKDVTVFYNREAAANENPNKVRNIGAGTKYIGHMIRNTDHFKLFDPAFEVSANTPYSTTICNKTTDTMPDGYYLLGLLSANGSGSCTFTVGISSINASVLLRRYGSAASSSSIELKSSSIMSTNNTEDKIHLCIGEMERDPDYNSVLYKVYLRKNTGSKLTSNILVKCDTHSDTWSFYKPIVDSLDSPTIYPTTEPVIIASTPLLGSA